MFVDWTVLFLAAWIPRFEGFVFDDEFGVFWTFDMSSHVLISLKHVHPMFVNWRVLFWAAWIPQFKGFVFGD